MIKIKPGPMLARYAEIYGCDMAEVIEWMSAYVNGPWAEGLPKEDTEQERLASIKGYISGMIQCSTYGRIRDSLATERRKAA